MLCLRQTIALSRQRLRCDGVQESFIRDRGQGMTRVAVKREGFMRQRKRTKASARSRGSPDTAMTSTPI